MTHYPPLPIPPSPVGDRFTYGISLFKFVVEHLVTATLDLEQLELADHAAKAFPFSLQRVVSAKRLIYSTILGRRADIQAAFRELGSVPPEGGTDPGSLVPLQPAPRQLPPVEQLFDQLRHLKEKEAKGERF